MAGDVREPMLAPNFTVSRRDVLDFAHPENLSEASGACRCKVKLNRRS